MLANRLRSEEFKVNLKRNPKEFIVLDLKFIDTD